MTHETLIIGAGLAGLTCARALHRAGRSCLVLEAGDEAGGRVRTDCVDGFLLDRGFQVLLTAYPEAERWLDYQTLQLQKITPGTLVWKNGARHRVSDPLRRPLDLPATLRAPVGSLADKFRIALLRWHAGSGSLDDLLRRPETTTLEALRRRGFSESMIESFLRPWLGGIFLESELATSSRMMEFVFRLFARGDTAVPAAGMQAIPRQLAAGLPAGTVRCGTPVTAIDGTRVHLATGAVLSARHLVLATDGETAARLLPGLPAPAWRAATTLYFASPRSPVGEPTLMLNGTGTGGVNTLIDLALVAPSYAPAGQSLLSLTWRGPPPPADDALESAVRGEMISWFGRETVASWRLLRIDRIRQALPVRWPLVRKPPAPLREGVWVCGDHRDTASIQGAMQSGRETAEVLASLS